jgi:CspA family cold shock protein
LRKTKELKTPMTNYRDTLVTCQECGKEFIYTVEKQRQAAGRGEEVTIPDKCFECVARIEYGGKLHGRVKWFDLEKGYGFVAEDSGEEIFVHRTGILRNEQGEIPAMEEGQEVLYEKTETPKGPQAVQVEPIVR